MSAMSTVSAAIADLHAGREIDDNERWLLVSYLIGHDVEGDDEPLAHSAMRKMASGLLELAEQSTDVDVRATLVEYSFNLASVADAVSVHQFRVMDGHVVLTYHWDQLMGEFIVLAATRDGYTVATVSELHGAQQLRGTQFTTLDRAYRQWKLRVDARVGKAVS